MRWFFFNTNLLHHRSLLLVNEQLQLSNYRLSALLKSIETEVGASGSVSDIAVLFLTLCERSAKIAEEKCDGKFEETAADVKKKMIECSRERQKNRAGREKK